jgi:hypothetical protein
MHEADAHLTAMAMNQGEDRVYAEFYLYPVQDKAKSLEEGRPVFIDKPYVKIMVPGDKDNIVQRPVRITDQERWPKQWNAFVNRQEQPVDGTPLSEWPGVTRAQVEEMKFFGVHSVEQLASMPDSQAQKFMGIQALKQKAKDYIEAAKGNAPLEQLRAENEELRNRMEALEEMLKSARSRRRKAEPDEE